MRVARSFAELKTYLPGSLSRPTWLVPTMGALHEGHGALVEKAKSEGGFVAVSIFVNPLQFGPGEDLTRYPRTEEADLDFLDRRGADLVFLPSAEEIVPPDAHIHVSSGPVGSLYCGASRPGHFDGVLTIVLKLFHLFNPRVALFGEKDRQQLFLIQKMVKDLNLPIKIIAHPTVREDDGLAMSSRNRYLSPDERILAKRFPDLLDETVRRWTESSGRPFEERIGQNTLAMALEKEGFRVDYVSIVDPLTFLPLTSNFESSRAFLLAAVYLGRTRLIDNRELPMEGEGV